MAGWRSKAAPMIRVFIVIEVCLYREGVAGILESADGFAVVGAASDVGACLPDIARQRPDVVLLDAGTSDGARALARLAAASPHVHVLAVAVRDVEAEIMRCVEAGAVGYVPRDASITELLGALRSAARGEAVLPPRIAACLMRQLVTLSASRRREESEAWNLTPREYEVVELLDRGLSNAEIARQLNIELATVKNHVHHILDKVGVKRRDQVASRVLATQGTGWA
jgi:two-component system nitrate/nitrite response regulator NarL